LLVVLLPVVPAENVGAAGLWALLAVSLVISVLAAVVNNLPASAVVAAALAPGPPAYAALIGLSIGALALPQGSVATLIVGDLAGESPHERSLTPIALAGAAAATLVMWSLRA
jgi:arsenical pump membrane protein